MPKRTWETSSYSKKRKSSGSLTKLYLNVLSIVLCHPREACPRLRSGDGDPDVLDSLSSSLSDESKSILRVDDLRGNDNLCQEV